MFGLLLASVSLVILQLAWRLWKKTVRENTRDRLFDLRESIRDFYIATGRLVGDEHYTALWTYLNNLLLRLEELSMMKAIAFHVLVKKFPEYSLEVKKRLEKMSNTGDQDMDAFTSKLFERSSSIAAEGISKTSITFTVIKIVDLAVKFGVSGKKIRRVIIRPKAVVDDIPKFTFQHEFATQ